MTSKVDFLLCWKYALSAVVKVIGNKLLKTFTQQIQYLNGTAFVLDRCLLNSIILFQVEGTIWTTIHEPSSISTQELRGLCEPQIMRSCVRVFKERIIPDVGMDNMYLMDAHLTLRKFVCTFHPVAPGSNPIDTIHTFMNLNLNFDMLKRRKSTEKEAGIGPSFKKKKKNDGRRRDGVRWKKNKKDIENIERKISKISKERWRKYRKKDRK